MGRKLNISTPTVINTELIPFNESFYIEADGQTEQWYYDNTGEYAPNRRVTPLTLTPHISVFDRDTKTSYTPLFNTMQWYVNEYNSATGQYEERLITDQVDGDTIDYLIVGFTLRVKANISNTRGATIRCVATYIDPRDAGITYTVQDQVLLTTNRDADVIFPDVAITNPSARAYNPLVDESSLFEFDAIVTNKPQTEGDGVIAKYSVDGWGTEELIPENGEEVTTCSPVMDIAYPEGTDEDVQFTFRPTADGDRLGEEGNAFITGIRGNSVAWNQMLENGDFSNGTTNWSTFGTQSGITVANKEATITKVGAGQSGAISYYNKILAYNTSHKYFIAGFIKSNTTGQAMCMGFHSTSGTVGGNTIISTTSEDFVRESAIVSPINNTDRFSLRAGTGTSPTGISGSAKNVICIDLTQMFGAGNEPSTVAEFESWLAANIGTRPYYSYNAGELIPVKTTGIKTTGFNQWDEEWEVGNFSTSTGEKTNGSLVRSKNFIEVLPNTAYYYSKAAPSGASYAARLFFYDINKNFISYSASPNAFTTPANAYYLNFTAHSDYGNAYNHDICINIAHNNSRNGEYEPYKGSTAHLDITHITGKLNGQGNSVSVFPDGMKRAGNVYDEIKIENGVVKAVKRVGSVDLGTRSWKAYSYTEGSTTYPYGYSGPVGVPEIYKHVSGSPFLTPKYGLQNYSSSFKYDKRIVGASTGTSLYVIDSSFVGMTAAQVTAAMSGVYLYYELATPKEYILDPVQDFADFIWYGIKDNVEVLVDTLPYYVSGQGTKKLITDALYGENINIVLRAKHSTTGVLSPSKDYANVVWRIPDIDSTVVCRQGSAVRSDTEEMFFETVINARGYVVPDDKKEAHLLQNWKYRRSTATTEYDEGYGMGVVIEASKLRNATAVTGPTPNTLVYPYIEVKGAYEPVYLDDGVTPVTDDNGEQVYGRI